MIDTRGKVCAALYAEIERQGEGLKQKDNDWVATDEVKVQSIIDAFDPLPDEIAAKQQLIKNEANKRIVGLLPTSKQRNNLASSIELLYRHAVGDITTSELSILMNSSQSLWDQVQAIRSASDAAETSIESLTLIELSSYNVESDW